MKYANLGEVLKDYELVYNPNDDCEGCGFDQNPCPNHVLDNGWTCFCMIFKRRPLSINAMLERLHAADEGVKVYYRMNREIENNG